ncbi:hypothetical protein C3F09_00050 [candidate division GN15 bacterium]|uniref:Calcineurin-like phosphoesterase domain-containing protein n=1 Tax=candidate division GN15 bacterium TaxID=2072418 RepID=A0A855XE54_9BACT|nr:MAG: hypothetical protein C3F09_00050 [candidate division GN15 bacterium]
MVLARSPATYIPAMRICHLSDSHLGAGEAYPRRDRSGLTLRQLDIINCFVEAVDRIVTLKPDLCIHSGDLFHAVRPSNRIMAIAGEQLHRLVEQHHIPTVLICGNHDAPKLTATGAAIEVYRNMRGLHIVSSPELAVIDMPGGRVLAVPHMHNAESFKAAIREAAQRRGDGFNILVTHGVAAGLPQFSMADLGEMEIPLELFEPFDYVALGHYHNFSKVAERVWYAGSTERLSMAEREAPKGFVSLNLEPFTLEFHEVSARPMVDLSTIDAAGLGVEDLLGAIERALSESRAAEKIVRLAVANVRDAVLRSIPVGALGELKQKAFALDLRFLRKPESAASRPFGRSGIGPLEEEFLTYLGATGLDAGERELFAEEGLRYLREEEAG